MDPAVRKAAFIHVALRPSGLGGVAIGVTDEPELGEERAEVAQIALPGWEPAAFLRL